MFDVKRIMAVLAVFIIAGAAEAEIIFSDNFEDGISPEWIIPHGGWEARDGFLCNIWTCGHQTCMPDIWAGGPGYGQYMVSFDLQLTGGNLNLYIFGEQPAEHQEGQTSAISINAGIGDGVCAATISRTLPWPEWEVLEYAVDSIFCWVPWTNYRVKFGRKEHLVRYKMWPVGEPEPAEYQIEAKEYGLNAGYWGFAFWNAYGRVDNFVVEYGGGVSAERTTLTAVKALYR